MDTRSFLRKAGHRHLSRSALGVALIVALAACGSPTEPGILQIYYDPSLGIDIRSFTQTASGLFYKDEAVGGGAEANPGSVVDFIVEGWLPTGEYTHEKETVERFTLGSGTMIAGVDEGLKGMRVGGTRRIVIPPHLAFGGGRVFIYKLELLDVR